MHIYVSSDAAERVWNYSIQRLKSLQNPVQVLYYPKYGVNDTSVEDGGMFQQETLGISSVLWDPNKH